MLLGFGGSAWLYATGAAFIVADDSRLQAWSVCTSGCRLDDEIVKHLAIFAFPYKICLSSAPTHLILLLGWKVRDHACRFGVDGGQLTNLLTATLFPWISLQDVH